jgi:hypothetical protein
MNPIALRLHEAALTLDGAAMPEIVAMLEIAEREIIRLEERNGVPQPSPSGLCNHGLPDGECRVDGCRHCREWSIEALIAAFYLKNIVRGATVTIPYRQTHDALIELKRLREMINTPQIMEFMTAVQIEAIHQRERWGIEHDAGKTDADWFWLIGYLAGKALHAGDKPPDAINPDSIPPRPIVTKQLHHIITTAAACLNWHAHKIGDSTRMRPGIEPPKGES